MGSHDTSEVRFSLGNAAQSMATVTVGVPSCDSKEPMEASPAAFSALDAVPGPADKRLAVRISRDALRQVRGGHPWIFDGAIDSINHHGAAGDLAVIFDDKRRFAAIGIYDPDSPISVRVLHAGPARTIDDNFWTEQVIAALDRRQELIDDADTDAFRLIHGENDGFPGLVVDRYATTGVIKLYSGAWFPHLRTIAGLLVELAGLDRLVLRFGRSVQQGETFGLAEATTIYGTPPTGPVEFRERGMSFEADVLLGQKTGHFLDQRDNRVLVGGLAAGARVLDVFSCTGGFSVHAAAGGATTVTSVDQSGPALETAVRNMARNQSHPGVAAARHDTIEGDAFEVMDDLRRRGAQYEIVIIDPPSFASNAARIDRAVHSYGRLTRIGLDLVKPGGLLVQSSCSSRIDEPTFHATINDAAAASGYRLEEWARTGHAVDHPVGFPEGRYLKTLIARVSR